MPIEPTDLALRRPIRRRATRTAFVAIFALPLAGCSPSAGYRAVSLNSPNQSIPPPRAVEGSSGNVQPSIPAGEIPGEPRNVGYVGCVRNEDCVPSQCCHPRACVLRAQHPRCEGVTCTMDCQAGTLDCGGSCGCQGGHCVARLNNARR